MRRFLRDNGLSVALFLLFLVSLVGQTVAGHRKTNAERRDHGQPAQTWGEYVRSDASLEATAENWESEFLQIFAYVVLTAYLYQRGSAESKDPDEPDAPEDREPDPTREGAPGPVRRGGLALRLYAHSLSLTFLALFAASLVLHAVGGAGEYNEEQAQHGEGARVTVLGYMGTSRFWFESLQNWQSEFLAIFAVVVLSIFLRERGSPESKPVDAAHAETGR
jgi:hypothetical protein